MFSGHGGTFVVAGGAAQVGHGIVEWNTSTSETVPSAAPIHRDILPMDGYFKAANTFAQKGSSARIHAVNIVK